MALGGGGTLHCLMAILGLGILATFEVAWAGIVSAPRDVRARPASATSVVVEWDEPETTNVMITGYTVFYTRHPDYPIVLWLSQDVNSSSTRMATIDGLEPIKPYTFSVCAYSKDSLGPMSKPVQVVLVFRIIEPLQPRNLVAKPVSPSEIEVSWDPPLDNDQMVSYTIYISEYYSNQNVQIKIPPSITEYKLKGLTPNTAYEIVMAGNNQFGQSARSVVVQARTPEYIPEEPKRVRVDTVNSTTLHVEWRQTNPNGVIIGYYIYYVKLNTEGEPIYTTEDVFDAADPDRNEAVVGGLDPDTTYSVTVAAYTRKGGGIRSKAETVSTNGAVPSAPRDLNLDLQQDDPPIIHVSWQKPEESHGNITHYKLYWGPKGRLYQELILPPGRMDFTTPLLQQGTLYEFRVMAKNEKDYGTSAVKEKETPSREPPTPVNVTALRASPSSILLTWDQPRDVQIIAKYRIYYCMYALPDMVMWDTLDTDGPLTAAHIRNVEPFSAYVIRVQAMALTNRWSNYSEMAITDFMPSYRKDTVQNFHISSRSSRQLTLSWDKPRKTNILNYKLEYVDVKYSKGADQQVPTVFVTKEISASLTEIVVRDLHPWTRYTFNITAHFRKRPGQKAILIAETQIEAPELVPIPRISNIVGERVYLTFEAASEENGPLSSYMIVVVHSDHRLPQDFTIDELTIDQLAVNEPSRKPYIAASFAPDRLPEEFILGDNSTDGFHVNRPLDADTDYYVFLRANTVKEDLYACSHYSGKISLGAAHNVPSTTQMTLTTTGTDYACNDSGVAGHSCSTLAEFFGSTEELCKWASHGCCFTCTSQRKCKNDNPVAAGGKVHGCSSLVQQFGKAMVCTIFMNECCVTCMQDDSDIDSIWKN